MSDITVNGEVLKVVEFREVLLPNGMVGDCITLPRGSMPNSDKLSCWI